MTSLIREGAGYLGEHVVAAMRAAGDQLVQMTSPPACGTDCPMRHLCSAWRSTRGWAPGAPRADVNGVVHVAVEKQVEHRSVFRSCTGGEG